MTSKDNTQDVQGVVEIIAPLQKWLDEEGVREWAFHYRQGSDETGEFYPKEARLTVTYPRVARLATGEELFCDILRGDGDWHAEDFTAIALTLTRLPNLLALLLSEHEGRVRAEARTLGANQAFGRSLDPEPDGKRAAAIKRLEDAKNTQKPDQPSPMAVVSRSGIYVASRASVPERGEMWRRWRSNGFPIISTWIDEDGPGETADFGRLWERISSEVTNAAKLVAFIEPDDLPLRGVFVEIGMALAAGVPVVVVAPNITLEGKSFRPLGSWTRHPLVSFAPDLQEAFNG